MDLKVLLGEELYAQVAEKTGEHKIAIVSDGSYIPKAKFDTKIEELNDLKSQIADRDTQLEELKKVDADGLQAKITELQQSNEQIKTEYESKLQQRDFDYALENALRDEKAKNPKAVKALLDLSKIQYINGELVGFKEQVAPIKTAEEYLFHAEGVKGNTPPTGNTGGKPQLTKEQFAQMSIVEKTKLYNENYDLYKSFTE